MRVSIASTLIAGGLLALGACAPVESTPMTLAELAQQCQRTGVAPTGRDTGDARHDYRCQAASAVPYREGPRHSGHYRAGRDSVIRQGG
jgi:hypothetical protein